MAERQWNQRRLVDLPRNWRLISAAGVAAFGLACGAGHPALGDWWALPKAKPAVPEAAPQSPRAAAPGARTTGPRTTAARARDAKLADNGNGFSATIRRLQTDARQHAEKGDLDKAVQLAERAAKISDASSQWNGSMSDCSPEQTARFANDLRSRRDALAGRGPRTSAAPQVAAVEPRSNTTASQPSQVAARPRAPQSPDNPIAAARDLSQPANRLASSDERDLAWAEDLPPTPAPEPEPLRTPDKFRRSVLNRAATEADESIDESRTRPDGRLVASRPDDAIVELLGTDTDLNRDFEQPVKQSPISASSEDAARENQTLTPRRAARSTTAAPVDEEEPPREPFREQIQRVAVDGRAAESSPSSTPFSRPPEWEDEDLNAPPIRRAKPTAPPANRSTTDRSMIESATGSTEKSAEPKVEPFSDESFPVQRVVLLRRRLESAASLNPGGAYTLSAQSRSAQGGPTPSVEEPSPTRAASSKSLSENSPLAPAVRGEGLGVRGSWIGSKSSETIPATRGGSMFDGDANPANVNSASDWTREPTAPNSDDNGSSLATNRRRSAFDAAPLTDATPEQAPRAERHFVKLREHRQPLEAAPQTPADALPPAHSTRRHVIGFSEPILWQSVEDRSPLVPTLSLVSSSRDGGARLASATSPSADLRDIARKGERPRASTQPDNSFLIPASGAESPNFGSIELSSDVARGSVARDSGAVGSVLFASSQSGLQTSLTDGPVLGGTTDSSSSYSSSPIPAGADQPRRSTGKKLAVAKSSHGVSRQSFALIEPLALSLKLPVATTASLLGGTGLALLGLGLLLVRAAFRWRHAG